LSVVSIQPCDDYTPASVERAVRLALADLGGMNRFVSEGQRVHVKPNLLSAKPPERAITTHPTVTAIVVKIAMENGAIVAIGDSPGGAVKGVARALEQTGTRQAAIDVGAEIANFETGGVVPRKGRDRTFQVLRHIAEADAWISVPKLKTHVLTRMTGAVKNTFGVIPGLRKSEYHKEAPTQKEFSSLIVDLYSVAKPNLIVMDAVVAMEGDGPASGDPRYVGFIIASDDAVAIDAVCARIMGLKPDEVLTTTFGAERGLGISDLSKIEVVGCNLERAVVSDFVLPSNRARFIPGPVAKLLAPLLWVKPAINRELCINCNMCVDSCPTEALHKAKPYPYFTYDDCIKCLCCHELCPERAVYLAKSWLASRL
jgi:uncharacterized protein (DUF362 family)/Pyruvate/2-oxoacid:ferredoxin oxidoreductase delta subunit